jgi:hypothetical protein
MVSANKVNTKQTIFTVVVAIQTNASFVVHLQQIYYNEYADVLMVSHTEGIRNEQR